MRMSTGSLPKYDHSNEWHRFNTTTNIDSSAINYKLLNTVHYCVTMYLVFD